MGINLKVPLRPAGSEASCVVASAQEAEQTEPQKGFQWI